MPEPLSDYEEDVITIGYAYNEHLNERQNIKGMIPKYYAEHGLDDSVITFPSLTVLLLEARLGIVSCIKPDVPYTHSTVIHYTIFHGMKIVPVILEQSPGATRHQGGSNYLFCDGHVKWFRPNQLKIDPKCDGMTPGFGI